MTPTPEQFAALVQGLIDSVVDLADAKRLSEVAKTSPAFQAARTAVLDAYAQAVDGWHMANGVADLAMKHRDLAEARAGGAVKVPTP